MSSVPQNFKVQYTTLHNTLVKFWYVEFMAVEYNKIHNTELHCSVVEFR